MFEIRGLKMILDWLKELPPNRKYIPTDIPDYMGLINEVRVSFLDALCNDCDCLL